MPSKKHSWRDDPTAPSAGGTRQKRWVRDQAKESGGAGFSRRTKILVASGALFVGVVAFLVVMFWPRGIVPPRLILIGAGYELNLALPHNAAGQRALGELQQWAEGHYASFPAYNRWKTEGRVRRADLAGEEDVILRELTAAQEQGDSSVVLYLSAHGGADTAGAFLFPRDASPGPDFSENPDKVVHRLDRVFAALEKLPAETRKLLILDTTAAGASWPLGTLHNGFVRALQADTRWDRIPGLVVLTASGPDQRSWASAELGRSVFGHFVLEGLRGAADRGSDAESNNGRITALELARFVQRKVEHWARHNRGALQTPLLLGSEEEAAAMELVGVDPAGYQEPAPGSYSEPAGLAQAWREHAELAQAVPPPAAYTPGLWRRYQDALLRYEGLLLAGDQENAGRMKAVADDLRGRVEAGRHLQQTAPAASLAAPAALDRHLTAQESRELLEEAQALWNNPEARPSDLTNLLPDPVRRRLQNQLSRVELTRFLLGQAVGGDQATLGRVCRLLPGLDDGLDPRPSEAEFALLLEGGLRGEEVAASFTAAPPWELQRTSLAVQLLAERAALGLDAPAAEGRSAAAYSEQILPWVRAAVSEADGKRRPGQDLVFAGPAAAAEAARLLSEAEAGYRPVAEQAARVRRALQVRDRALAELPYLTAWESGPMPDVEEDQLAGKQEELKVRLWEQVHLLGRLLASADPAQVEALARPAEEIEKGLDELAARFRERCAADRSIQQRHWHQLRDLLGVPLIEPELRLSMLRELHEISAALQAGTEKATQAGGATAEQTEQLAESAARRQGRLALAVLGPDSPEARVVDTMAWTPDGVGEQVGRGFRRLGAEAARLTDEASRLPLGEGVQLLRQASWHARFLDGATAEAWLGADPVEQRRRAETHQLLLWQAGRVHEDFWAPPGGGDPYYQRLARVYLGEAEAVLKGGSDELTRLQGLVSGAEAAARSEMAVHWFRGEQGQGTPATLHITDEDLVPRSFGLAAAEGVPAGRPVVWSGVGKGLKFSEKTPPERRALAGLGDKAAGARFEYDLAPYKPMYAQAKEKSVHEVHGWYRGRHFKLETPVVLHYQPDVTSLQPVPPNTTSLAIQADRDLLLKAAAANSHILLALDCSGSMKAKDPTGKTRYQRVLEALEAALEQLPRGVTLSLMTFGDGASGDGLTVRWQNEEWQETAAQRERLMGQLRRLPTEGWTPLVYATFRASQEFPARDDLSKTMVVLTDGVDEFEKGSHFGRNRDETGRTFHEEGESIKAFLERKFPPRARILVNVIGVEVDESKKPRQKEFIEGVHAIGGEYFDVGKTRDLVAVLQKAMFNMRYFVEERSGTVPPGTLSEEGADIGPVGSDLRVVSGLLPGGYTASLKRTRLHRGLDHAIEVDRGDVLVLRLLGLDRKAGVFRRTLYRELHGLSVPHKVVPGSGTDWHVEVLQNQRQGLGMQMMVTVERERQKENVNYTYLPRPSFAWFAVRGDAKGSPPVSGLRFSPLYHYPAPAWGLDYASWGGDRKPVLDVYWREEGASLRPALSLSPERLGLGSLLEVSQRVFPKLSAGSGHQSDVVVEGVQVKRLEVEVRPGERREESCLVVRLSYEDGARPFFARLPGLGQGKTGEEHRFYTEAGKYTGIFWPVTEADAQRLPIMEVIAVDEACTTPESSFRVTGWEQETPSLDSSRPLPVGK